MNPVDVDIDHCSTDNMCEGLFTKPLRGRKIRRFRSVILLNSRENKPSPPRNVLDPNDGIIADAIGGISKLVGGAHVRARKVKIWGNG